MFLILLLFLLKPVYRSLGRCLFLGELLHLHYPLGTQRLSFLFHSQQGSPFRFKFGLGLLDLFTLSIHLPGQILQKGIASHSLPQIVTGDNIHIPELRVAILVRTLDQPVVIEAHRIQTKLKAVNVFLLPSDLGIQLFYSGVAFSNQALSEGNLLLNEV